jgi:hypothetical protein
MEGTDRISSISTVPPFCAVCQSFCLAWDQGLRSAAENGFSTLRDLFLGLKKKKAENFFDKKDKEKTKEFFFCRPVPKVYLRYWQVGQGGFWLQARYHVL